MPLFEVAIIQKPTKKDAEDGVPEKLVFGPKAVIARDNGRQQNKQLAQQYAGQLGQLQNGNMGLAVNNLAAPLNTRSFQASALLGNT